MTENTGSSADSMAHEASAGSRVAPPIGPPVDAPAGRADTARRPPLQGLRRTAIVVLVVSVTVTAAIGIFTLLNGAFGDVQGRILSTTLFVALFSVLALCHLAVAGRPVRAVGFVGLAVSAVALATGIAVVWLPWDHPFISDLWRVLGVTSIIAASLAQTNLLLLLASRRRTVIRVGLAITLTAIAVVAIMSCLPMLTDGAVPGTEWETYWRWMGVAAIVDALGTIALPVLGLLVRDPVDAVSGADAAGPTSGASARPALDDRIDALASATGLDRETLLETALDAFEAQRVHGPADDDDPARTAVPDEPR
jgi:hypothetical protein